MDKRLEKSLEINSGITEEFEELSKDCFERIFDMLGKKNFERWINKRQLAPRIKELVVESMDDREKRENPHWGGYYTRGTNRIRLGIKSRDVATHEKFHFMTDHGSNFPTFIDEGLTEYLKSLVEGKETAYIENVAVVKFLHYICGDSIVKAYLLGNVSVFDNKIVSLLADKNGSDGTRERKKLEEFYENLNLFHEYKSAELKYEQALNSKENDYSDAELEDMEESISQLKQQYVHVEYDVLSMFEEIAVAGISKMAKDFEFYKNGALDVGLINRTISDVLRKVTN